jgi:hypothetical protein
VRGARAAFAVALVFAFACGERAAFAQAEPAPESYRPPHEPGMPQPEPPSGPTREEQAKQPKWHIAVAPHLNFLLGDRVPDLPLLGYGGGIQVARALIPIGRARFGVGADFGYDRFQHDLKTSSFTSGTQFVAHATFAAMAVLDGIAGRVRPWLALGGGLSVANYESPATVSDPKGASLVGVAGLVKVAAGVGVEVYQGFELGLRADYDATLSSKSVNGTSVWQPGFFSLGLDLGFRM